jgi:hypothetical protein
MPTAAKTSTKKWGHREVVTFGDALRDLVAEAHIGGMPGVERAVLTVVGPFLGKRATFTDLYKLTNAPTEPSDPDSARAWVVIALCGDEPALWGIGDDVIPPGFRTPAELREKLRAAGSDATLR